MIRTILHHPDPLLRRRSSPVEAIDDGVRALAIDLAETMYAWKAVGLAAPQVGVLSRVIVVDVAPAGEPRRLLSLVNPVLGARTGRVWGSEGCLSFPGQTESLCRAKKVTVRALGLDGAPVKIDAAGLLAIALQHEIDHLDGVLMVDRSAGVIARSR